MMKKLRLRLKSLLPALIFGICFIIACMFLYWAVEYYIDKTFDVERYSLIRATDDTSDAYVVWKLDERTGTLDLCTKPNNRVGYLACLTAVNVKPEEFQRISEMPRPVVVQPAPVAAPAAVPAAAPAAATPAKKR